MLNPAASTKFSVLKVYFRLKFVDQKNQSQTIELFLSGLWKAQMHKFGMRVRVLPQENCMFLN